MWTTSFIIENWKAIELRRKRVRIIHTVAIAAISFATGVFISILAAGR